MIARIAALSGAGSFDQTATTRDRSGQAGTLVCVSSCVPAAQNPCEIWRREGDSNPRYGFWPYNGLANHRLQPLGHLSTAHSETCPGFSLKLILSNLASLNKNNGRGEN